jgi:hypothetical protein
LRRGFCFGSHPFEFWERAPLKRSALPAEAADVVGDKKLGGGRPLAALMHVDTLATPGSGSPKCPRQQDLPQRPLSRSPRIRLRDLGRGRGITSDPSLVGPPVAVAGSGGRNRATTRARRVCDYRKFRNRERCRRQARSGPGDSRKLVHKRPWIAIWRGNIQTGIDLAA